MGRFRDKQVDLSRLPGPIMENSTKWSIWLIVGVIAILRLSNLAVYYAQNQFVGVIEAEDVGAAVSVVPAQAVLNSQNNPNNPVEPVKIENEEDIFRNREELAKKFITAEAIKNNIDPVLANWIVKKESNFSPNAVGDTDKTCLIKGKNFGKQLKSVGYWQFEINCYNTEISEQEALSVPASTAIAMKWLKEGKQNRWSVVSHCKKWFTDCPLK